MSSHPVKPSKDTQTNSSLVSFFNNTVTKLRYHSYSLYLLTLDDTPTFVIPNTVFGISSALTTSLVVFEAGCTRRTPLSILILAHSTLRTISFNWTNLLIFDLANQRVAGDEDILNKPWRPIPSKRMDSTQMRYWLIVAIPIVIAYNHFFLGVGIEASLLAILTWIYNDLRGGDDNCIVRNFVIACAFGLYNIGSLKVASTSFIHPYDKTYTNTKAVPATNTIIPTAAETTTIWASLVGSTSPTSHVTVSSLGYWWVFFVSGIIFTTMHIQDFKDIEGDRTRGRNSLPIVYGRRIAGWTIAVPAILWSLVCARFWALSYFWASFPIGLSLIVAWRCVMLDGKSADRRTWQLWTLWTALVYLIPLMSTPG